MVGLGRLRRRRFFFGVSSAAAEGIVVVVKVEGKRGLRVICEESMLVIREKDVVFEERGLNLILYLYLNLKIVINLV